MSERKGREPFPEQGVTPLWRQAGDDGAPNGSLERRSRQEWQSGRANEAVDRWVAARVRQKGRGFSTDRLVAGDTVGRQVRLDEPSRFADLPLIEK